ncbi:GNAT family N-acetyltransferase [Granulicella sp. dw_53]|uniref:GNAT family N-acetyltransferase n=1 Tax=Granulicella sp. dw_53 TaxID=2719792 RepID=UPI001BD1EB9A|nr:GNAT family N-acetyltransferase [Granulicella sp. dw_53]
MGHLIRQARLEDAAAIAHVHVESWRTTYSGIVPDAFLATLDEVARTESWRERIADGGVLIVVAEGETGVVGFACAGPIRTATADYDAELYAIYVLLEAQRQGAGRSLFHAVVSGLRAKGYRSMLLWALQANPCVPFYVRLGGIEVAMKAIDIGGVDLPEKAFGWPDLDCFGA